MDVTRSAGKMLLLLLFCVFCVVGCRIQTDLVELAARRNLVKFIYTVTISEQMNDGNAAVFVKGAYWKRIAWVDCSVCTEQKQILLTQCG